MIPGPDGSIQGKRILVTGAGGFLGSHLVERLVQEGAQVAALDLSEGKLSGIDGNPDCEFLACDLSNSKQAIEAIRSFAPKVLVHLASEPDASESFDHMTASIQRNLVLTLNALEGFNQCCGELFLYGDSCKVYGNSPVPYRQDMPPRPLSSYAVAKVAGWEYCRIYSRLYGFRTVSIRPTLTYGPRQSYNLFSYVIDCIMNQKEEICLDGGDQTRDPLYVDDTIAAYRAVIHREVPSGSVINIGGGRERSVNQLAALVQELMGTEIPIVPRMSFKRPTEIQRNYCDNVEADQLIGWTPQIDLRTGLQKTIPFLVEQWERLSVVKSQSVL